MLDRYERLLVEYRTERVLVDTTLLLGYVVGVYERQWIERFHRTSAFTSDDIEPLDRLLGHFETAATPLRYSRRSVILLVSYPRSLVHPL